MPIADCLLGNVQGPKIQSAELRRASGYVISLHLFTPALAFVRLAYFGGVSSSAKGAKCDSLGQRPRLSVISYLSAEGAE
jgi:hypothetical protein